MTSYLRDPVSGVWLHPMRKSIGYSDGDEAEMYLLDILKKARDVSCGSPQLGEAIMDWPSEYHFSPARHNILRPFKFISSHRVLELGCGCGAITRYLGETGAKVVGIEGSLRRAEIAAERCRDLPNVNIHADNLIEFQSGEKFDYVTLIGVLEYAQCFIESPDPVGACLEHARSFLNKDGTLILAIENQLGLKYFNGCMEDHKAVPYYGINGLYSRNDPITFGRRALADKLNQHGFSVQEFYYPFPDYKLPGLILSEAALLDERLNVADLLIHNVGRDYPETYRRVFAEDLAWRVVRENGLLPDLANSFLIFASLGDAPLGTPKWLAKMYNRGQRRPSYRLESTIEENDAGRLIVRKKSLHTEGITEQGWLRHTVIDSDYIKGNLLIGKIHRAMAREVDIEELAVCFLPWIGLLLANATLNAEGVAVLPGSFVDCIPTNLIEDEKGTLQYFDAEWSCAEPIALAWVVVRGVHDSLAGCLENRQLKGKSLREIVRRIALGARIEFLDKDFTAADSNETALTYTCFEGGEQKRVYEEIIDTPLPMINRYALLTRDNVDSLERAEGEIRRMKRTLSWQITKPLRLLANLPRLVRNRVQPR